MGIISTGAHVSCPSLNAPVVYDFIMEQFSPPSSLSPDIHLTVKSGRNSL